jgi:hypothetical protein
MDALTLRGEEHTHDTLLLATVTTDGIDLEVFDGVKGKVRITLSEKKWVKLMEFIEKGREHIYRMKYPTNEILPG